MCPRSFATSCLSDSISWARSTTRFCPDESSCPSRASIAERRSSIAFWRASTWFFSWKICLRASSSSKRAAWAAPATSAAQTARVIRSRIALVFPAVEHVAAAVLPPARLVVIDAARLFLAEADRLDLCFGRSHQHEHALDPFGSALPERDVVFAASALVAVALDEHLLAAVLGEILAVGLEHRAELVLDVVLVVLIENGALRQIDLRGGLDRARRERRRHRPWSRRLHVGRRGLFGFYGRAGASVEQRQGQSGKQRLLHDDLLSSDRKNEEGFSPRAPLSCGRERHSVAAVSYPKTAPRTARARPPPGSPAAA